VLKVTCSEGGDGTTILALEGRLADGSVDEAARAAGAAMADAGTAITLDLSGLTFVDARGAHMLRSLGERGARLMGGSKYVATLVAGSTP
jgi:anti-anti-sigma regulatory factor